MWCLQVRLLQQRLRTLNCQRAAFRDGPAAGQHHCLHAHGLVPLIYRVQACSQPLPACADLSVNRAAYDARQGDWAIFQQS